MKQDEPWGSPWTLSDYRKLCSSVIDSGYAVQCVSDFIGQPAQRAVIMRHDVDRFPGNAVRMAQVENEHGLRATYYFRVVPGVFDIPAIERVHELGH